jgi:hypothetical protein
MSANCPVSVIADVLVRIATRYENLAANLLPSSSSRLSSGLREGAVPFPADPGDIANYLAERAAVGQSVSTLRTVVAAIKAGMPAACRSIAKPH